MFIVWGRRETQKKLGWVADFCHHCDDARPFRLYEHRRVAHVYYVPLGRGTPTGHTGRCHACRRRMVADPPAYEAIVRKRPAAIEALVDQTHPGLPETIAAALDRRDRIAAGDATPDDRHGYLLEQVAAAAPLVDERAAQTHLDAWTGLAFLGVFAAPIMVVAVLAGLNALIGIHDVVAMVACGVSLVAPIAAVVYFIATDVRRFYRRRVEPDLLARLVLLKPTDEELALASSVLTAGGSRMARYFTPQRVRLLLDQREAAQR